MKRETNEQKTPNPNPKVQLGFFFSRVKSQFIEQEQRMVCEKCKFLRIHYQLSAKFFSFLKNRRKIEIGRSFWTLIDTFCLKEFRLIIFLIICWISLIEFVKYIGEKKLSKVIVPDKWKEGASNTTEGGGRKINENKLLSKKKRFAFSLIYNFMFLYMSILWGFYLILAFKEEFLVDFSTPFFIKFLCGLLLVLLLVIRSWIFLFLYQLIGVYCDQTLD